MRAIFQSLPGLIDELPSPEAQEAIVFAIWPTVLGEHLRERSAPLSFANGILSVAVSSAEWKSEFKKHAAEIVYKLNRPFGKSLVERIDFAVDTKTVDQGKRRSSETVESKNDLHMASNEIKKAAGKIADTGLRTHFMEAAAACVKRRDAK